MKKLSIEWLHRTKSGKASDKWASYLPYYDFLFGPLRDQAIDMLEIGVQNGGSLDTWSQYFQNGRNFIGCDIDTDCAQLSYDDPRISIVVGDANAATAFQTIKNICSEFDIIIDDGSHKSIDILNSFVNYFPLVKPGGIYVVEDTHALYSSQFGGGILNEYSAYAFFKRLIDVTNFQFWRADLSISTYFSTFFPDGNTPSFITDGWIESIDFRNSIITIIKSHQADHEKLGARVIVGTSAQVQNLGISFKVD
jgi:hypothetical protein